MNPRPWHGPWHRRPADDPPPSPPRRAGGARSRTPLILFTAIAAAALAAPAQDAPPPASAPEPQPQQAAAKPADAPLLTVEFGFGGSIVGGRWAPIILRIDGSGLTKPFEGYVVLQYDQDATQAARVVTAVTASPGRSSVSQMIAHIPATCQRLDFGLHERAAPVGERTRVEAEVGRRLQSLVFTQSPEVTESQLPTALPAGTLFAVGVGDPSGAAASIHSLLDNSVAARVRFDRFEPTPVLARPERLPLVWPGYDGAAAVAVDADAAGSLDPRALAAVHEWVAGGGRLIILAAKPGAAWRRWLPPGPPGEVVTLDEPAYVTLPAAIASSIARAGVEAELAASTLARASHLTEAAIATGWSASWPEARYLDETPAGPTASGPIVEGPVGLGRVTIVGLDPRRLAVQPSVEATRALWALLIAKPDDPFAPRPIVGPPTPRQSIGWPYVYYGNAYGYNYAQPEDTVYTLLLDALATAPLLGSAALAAVTASVVALVLLMGPIDYIVLGRLRRRHRSWLTAGGWVALASLAALLAPSMVRSAETSIGRLRIIDAIAPPPATDAPGGPAPLAWQTALTGVYAGSSLRAAFITPSPAGPPEPAPGWWRGVAAAPYYGERRRLVSEFPILESLPDVAAAAGIDNPARDPWGGLGSGARDPAAAGRAAPLPTRFQLWTLRTAEDRRRIPLPFTATLGGADAARRVTIDGLPPGAVIEQASLRVLNSWQTLTQTDPPPPPPPPGTTGRGTTAGTPAGHTANLPPASTIPSTPAEGRPGPRTLTAAPPTPGAPANAWTRPAPAYGYGFAGQFRGFDLAASPAEAFEAPGPKARTPAVQSMLATGRWAALYLYIRDLPPDITLDRETATSRMAVVRMLIPIGPTTGPTAPTPTPPTTPTPP